MKKPISTWGQLMTAFTTGFGKEKADKQEASAEDAATDPGDDLQENLIKLAEEMQAKEDELQRLKAELQSAKNVETSFDDQLKELKAQVATLQKENAIMAKMPITLPTTISSEDGIESEEKPKKVWETAAHNPHLN
jgi:chromosome segregation ATPase